jgi:PAS domain S-box-containing protein
LQTRTAGVSEVPFTDELLRTVENVHNHIFKYSRNKDGQFVVTLSEGKIAQEFGLTTKNLRGKGFEEVLLTCDAANLLHHFEKAYKGHVMDYESTIGARTFTTTLSPVIVNGTVREVVGSTTEITERKQIEEQLMETQELYRSLVEDTLIGVYIAYVDEPGFVYVNPSLADMFGYSQEEMVNRTAVEMVVPEDRAVVRRNQERRLEGDRSNIRYQFRGMCRNGNTIDVEVLQKTSTYKGKPAVIGFLQDVTERKQAEEMIRKTELLSVVGQMAAGVAHEIRNPLTSLKGFVQLLKTQGGKQEYLSIMLSELNRIEFIISEFLVLAKPQVVVHRQCEIKPLLEHIITLAKTHAIMQNVQIVTHYAKDLPVINCEENQVKQVFLNLLKNAIESMPNGGKVAVSVQRDEEDLVISFKDEGCGIPEDRIAKLGEPFYTTKSTGTGLGLMVSFKIISHHGGKILVKSKVDEGTTFEVRLPVE